MYERERPNEEIQVKLCIINVLNLTAKLLDSTSIIWKSIIHG